MAYGDKKFRHDLRNILNSFSLALAAYQISDSRERAELMEMMVRTADEAIAIIDNNPPAEEDLPQQR